MLSYLTIVSLTSRNKKVAKAKYILYIQDISCSNMFKIFTYSEISGKPCFPAMFIMIVMSAGGIPQDKNNSLLVTRLQTVCFCNSMHIYTQVSEGLKRMWFGRKAAVDSTVANNNNYNYTTYQI